MLALVFLLESVQNLKSKIRNSKLHLQRIPLRPRNNQSKMSNVRKEFDRTVETNATTVIHPAVILQKTSSPSVGII